MADGLPKQGPGLPEPASGIEGSDTMLAWERFLTGAPFAQTPTRNFVVSSWLRSRDLGIDPTARAAPILRDIRVLKELRRRHRELIGAAHALFQEAEGLLAGTRSILLLTTHEGNSRQAWSTSTTSQPAREHRSQPIRPTSRRCFSAARSRAVRGARLYPHLQRDPSARTIAPTTSRLPSCTRRSSTRRSSPSSSATGRAVTTAAKAGPIRHMSGNSSTPAKGNESSAGSSRVAASGPLCFTPETLARFDGSDPRLPVLIAYSRRVNDVSRSFLRRSGRHFRDGAGRDLTGTMWEAPHGGDMLERAHCVGVLHAASER